ncbi:MAG: hypothetical protein QXT14_08850 [Candidatus Bathyarchaeia archaeon]
MVKMRSEEINLPGAGGQAPETKGEGEGATPKSPIYLLEEMRRMIKQMNNSECLVEKVYKLARETHDRFCDYPCFTLNDVKAFLSVEEDEPFVLENEGTTVITKAGAFGNLSYSHFFDSVINAVEEMLKEATIRVRVVQAHNTNLHLKNLRLNKSTKIMFADKLLLTNSLVNYVIKNGDAKVREQWGYSRIAHSRVKYTNKVFTLIMSAEEVLSHLKITSRNRNSNVCKRILEVLGLEVEE